MRINGCQWDDIASTINTNRTGFACMQKYNSIIKQNVR